MQGLRVYRLALEFYWMVLKLRLPPELSGQLRRAATSIINNIKEGSSRRTLPDRLRFYDIAFGSAKESQGGCRRSAFGCRWYDTRVGRRDQHKPAALGGRVRVSLGKRGCLRSHPRRASRWG